SGEETHGMHPSRRGINVGQGRATAPTQRQRPELRGSSAFRMTTCRTLARDCSAPTPHACASVLKEQVAKLLLPPRWHSLALLARFGKANGDRLLAALHLAAAPGFAALGGAALVTAHFALNFGARTGGIFSAAFLCHAVLLRRNDARARSVFRACLGLGP